MQGYKIHYFFKRLLVLMAFISLSAIASFAQQAVSGTVKDATGEPLPGVTVVIKGTTVGIITDFDGNYTLKTQSAADVLSFSMIGMKTQEFAVGDQTAINVTMREDQVGLDEVVVVGYGSLKKKDVTGSVASIGADDLLVAPIASIDQGMQGKMAGVAISNTTGAPGQGMKIRIRGGSSITGTNDPLYVIDGFIGGDITSINPSDIERIDILKDASATAVYGSRGANGVVLVTTKTAKSGEFKVSFDAQYGISNLVKQYEFLSALESAELLNERAAATKKDAYFDEAALSRIASHGGGGFLDDVTRTGTNQQYNLSMSGGSEKLTYLFSMGYLDQQGVINNSFSKRYSVRSNVSAEIKPWLDLKFNTFATHNDYMNNGVYNRTINDAYRYPIFYQNKDANGNYLSVDPQNQDKEMFSLYNGLYTTFLPNPGYYNELQSNQENMSETVTSNIDFTFKFTPKLQFKSSYAGRYYAMEHGSMPGVDKVFVTKNSQGITQNTARWWSLLSTQMLTYKNTWGLHDFTAMTLYEFQEQENRTRNLMASPLASTQNDWYLLQNGDANRMTSAFQPSKLQSGLARVNYSYADKYLVTAAVRYDQSSRFSSENNAGLFRSFAAGWTISEEGFLAGVEWISNLKLRAGWGETGNAASGIYARHTGMVTPYGYGYWGYTTWNGEITEAVDGLVTWPSVTSEDVKWETTTQSNVGVDLSILGGKFTFNADYYVKTTTDVIFKKSVPKYTGKDNVMDNFGEIQNRGLELNGDWRAVKTGDFSMNVSGNIAFNRNEVVSLDGEDQIFLDENSADFGVWDHQRFFVLKEGQPLGLFYGLKKTGIWQENEAEEAAKYKSSKPGEPKYEDLNNDYDLGANDHQVIGQVQPDFTYGLNVSMNYKNWNLSIGGIGSVGNQLYNYNRHFADVNALNVDYRDAWSPTNSGSNQQILPYGPDWIKSANLSSEYVEDASFFKINNVTLSYNFPQEWINKIHLNYLNLFVSVNNVMVITNYSGLDPENTVNSQGSDSQSGIDAFSYPLSRTYTFGLKTNF